MELVVGQIFIRRKFPPRHEISIYESSVMRPIVNREYSGMKLPEFTIIERLQFTLRTISFCDADGISLPLSPPPQRVHIRGNSIKIDLISRMAISQWPFTVVYAKLYSS